MTRRMPCRPHRTPSSPSLTPARAQRRATAAALTVILAATLPRPALASPAEIDTDYDGPAEIDTDYGGPAEIDTDFQGPSAEMARTLTQQGQSAFDAGDYLNAAEAWKKLLDILPENEFNRKKRQNAVLIALEAYKQAFRRVVVQRGEVSEVEAQLLREALALCDAYTNEARQVHGPAAVSPPVVESRVEIESMLLDAGYATTDREKDNGGIIIGPGPIIPTPPGPPGKSGVGLISAGSASLALGLGMMPLVIIGARRRQQANADINTANSDDDPAALRDAEDRRQSANAMLISGSILMGVLTIGGATMLGIGIRRRIRYTALAPVMGPSYVGLTLRRRF